MNLYIEIENGQPKNHPVLEGNLIQAFGNISEKWELFVRIHQPDLGAYELFDDPKVTYKKIDGVWTDVFHVRDMTAEEKIEKQKRIKSYWATQYSANNFTAWIFNEITCKFEPPTPYPNDGKIYFWQGVTNSWVDLPQYPDDGKPYRLDYTSATWVEFVSPTQG